MLVFYNAVKQSIYKKDNETMCVYKCFNAVPTA
jgi:hypothetical protein